MAAWMPLSGRLRHTRRRCTQSGHGGIGLQGGHNGTRQTAKRAQVFNISAGGDCDLAGRKDI